VLLAAGCEWWTLEVVVLLSGLLPNPHQAMSVMGISINLHAVAFLAAQGVGGAASTCVAQDLGAGQPKQAVHNMKVSAMACQLHHHSCTNPAHVTESGVCMHLRSCAHRYF
jgi:Na+-driven multidrug efflux pump